MTKSNDEQKQLPLQRRARRLQWLQGLDLNGYYAAKWLLRAIDDRIGNCQQEVWKLSTNRLIEHTNIPPGTFYKAWKWLRDECLIDAEPVPGRHGWHEVRIIWSNIQDLIIKKHAEKESAKRPPARRVTPKELFERGEPSSNGECQFSGREKPFSNGGELSSIGEQLSSNGGLHSLPENCTLIPVQSVQSSSPPVQEKVGVGAVEMKLRRARLLCVDEAIERGTALRSIEELEAIIDHFLEHFWLPNGPEAFGDLTAGFLFWRLTDPVSAKNGPSDGWKVPTGEFVTAQRRRRDLEREEAERAKRSEESSAANKQRSESADEREALENLVGDELDQMTKGNLLQLIPDKHPKAASLRRAVEMNGRNLVRVDLLRLLVGAMGGNDRAERDLTSAAMTGREPVNA